MEYSSNATAQAAYVSNDTLDAYTKVCSHFTGADGTTSYTDPVAGAYTFVGTAQIDTAYSPFTGGSSLLLDGNSDYITLADSADWNFGTGNFTIEGWFRFADLTGYQTIATQYVDASNNWWLRKDSANTITFFANNASASTCGFYTSTSAYSFAINTWYHIVFERNGAGALLFINGISIALTETTAFGTLPDVAAVLCIGAHPSPNFYINGNIAEFRITKGLARWTSNFTPPTVPYPNDLYCLSESTIKTQGSYSLKVTAAATTSLNKTLTKTF